MPQLQSSLLKYWVLTSIPDEVGGVHEARPLGFPPNWPIQRGWQGIDFREDGKFSFFTFAANDGRVELVGSWEPEPDSGHIHITLPKDTGDAHTDLGVSEESFTSFTLEIVALEDELLKARILEEVPADDAELARDVNVGGALFMAPAIWPRNDDALP